MVKVVLCLIFVLVFITLAILLIPAAVDSGPRSLVQRAVPERRLHYYDGSPGALVKRYILCGTHGSGAYSVDTTCLVDDRGVPGKKWFGLLFPGIVGRFTKNQHYDVFNQLMLGVRFVHLEVSWLKDGPSTGRYVVIHSYYCAELLDILAQIHTFLQRTQKGFVCVQFQIFGPAPPVSLEYLLQSHEVHAHRFGGVLDDRTTFSDVYGKFIVLHNFQQVPIAALNTYPGFQHEIKREIQEVGETNFKNTGLAWVMTPNTSTIVHGLFTPFSRRGLYNLESVLDQEYMKKVLFTDEDKIQNKYLCITMDHISESHVTLVDALNFVGSYDYNEHP